MEEVCLNGLLGRQHFRLIAPVDGSGVHALVGQFSVVDHHPVCVEGWAPTEVPNKHNGLVRP